MMNRGRGNFRRGGGPSRAPFTGHDSLWDDEDEKTAKEIEEKEKEAESLRKAAHLRQKQLEKEERKAAELALWPEIETSYKPEVWRQKYQTDHAQTFLESVDRLQKMKGWSYEEAEKTLLDILVKITFIETNLTVNGPATAEDLFDNLQLAQGDEATIPFESPKDVAAFCDSMPVNFRQAAGKRYRNTGVQGRRLVQYLKTRLELGDVVDEDCWDKIKEDFCKTIHVKEEIMRKFANEEAGLDYSSLWFLAKKIPGFQFDKTKGQLSLTPESVDSLPLNLPILTDTINSAHPRKIDYSRKMQTFAMNAYYDGGAKKSEMPINAEMKGLHGAFFRKTIQNPTVTPDRPVTLVHGFVRPNQKHCPIEIFTAEPTTFCFLNNVCTKTSSSVLIKNTVDALNFETADRSEQHRKKQIVSRLRVEKKED